MPRRPEQIHAVHLGYVCSIRAFPNGVAHALQREPHFHARKRLIWSGTNQQLVERLMAHDQFRGHDNSTRMMRDGIRRERARLPCWCVEQQECGSEQEEAPGNGSGVLHHVELVRMSRGVAKLVIQRTHFLGICQSYP